MSDKKKMKDPISRMYYHNGNVIEDTVTDPYGIPRSRYTSQ